MEWKRLLSIWKKVYELIEGKGFFQEYDSESGYLIFKGDYINGEKNGKGREYDHAKLLFEGEYLNWKRNGKGKEYVKNGIILFEGEYLDEKR